MWIPRVLLLICTASIACLSFVGQPAFADSVGSQTAAGDNIFSETVTYNGQSAQNNRTGNGLNWNLNDSTYRMKTATPVTKREITDTTNSVVGGLGWNQTNWEFGADLTYSKTAAESLHSVGPDAYLGYTFTHDDTNNDDSARSFELKGTYAAQRYTEDFSRPARAVETDRQLSRPAVSVTQSAGSIEATVVPEKWASLDATYTAYSYNRNIKRFARFLDSTRAASAGLSGLSSTISGFPSHMTEVDLTLGPFAKWTLDLDSSYIISAIDHSITHTARIVVSRDIAHWNVGVGAERDSIPVIGEQNLGLLNISYNF